MTYQKSGVGLKEDRGARELICPKMPEVELQEARPGFQPKPVDELADFVLTHWSSDQCLEIGLDVTLHCQSVPHPGGVGEGAPINKCE